MGTFRIEGTAAARGANPALAKIMEAAAARSPYDVVLFSGDRHNRSGSRHYAGEKETSVGTGNAVDVVLIDPATGLEVPNLRSKEGFPVYEQFAMAARDAQQAMYPNLSDQFRWGGWFVSSTPGDLMHFDFQRPGGPMMAGGDWRGGTNATGRNMVAGWGRGEIYSPSGSRSTPPNHQVANLWTGQPARTTSTAYAATRAPTGGQAAATGLASGRGDPQVRALQERLKAAGFDPGPIDGIRGPRTMAAERAAAAPDRNVVQRALDTASRVIRGDSIARTGGTPSGPRGGGDMRELLAANGITQIRTPINRGGQERFIGLDRNGSRVRGYRAANGDLMIQTRSPRLDSWNDAKRIPGGSGGSRAAAGTPGGAGTPPAADRPSAAPGARGVDVPLPRARPEARIVLPPLSPAGHVLGIVGRDADPAVRGAIAAGITGPPPGPTRAAAAAAAPAAQRMRSGDLAAPARPPDSADRRVAAVSRLPFTTVAAALETPHSQDHWARQTAKPVADAMAAAGLPAYRAVAPNWSPLRDWSGPEVRADAVGYPGPGRVPAVKDAATTTAYPAEGPFPEDPYAVPARGTPATASTDFYDQLEGVQVTKRAPKVSTAGVAPARTVQVAPTAMSTADRVRALTPAQQAAQAGGFGRRGGDQLQQLDPLPATPPAAAPAERQTRAFAPASPPLTAIDAAASIAARIPTTLAVAAPTQAQLARAMQVMQEVAARPAAVVTPAVLAAAHTVMAAMAPAQAPSSPRSVVATPTGTARIVPSTAAEVLAPRSPQSTTGQGQQPAPVGRGVAVPLAERVRAAALGPVAQAYPPAMTPRPAAEAAQYTPAMTAAPFSPRAPTPAAAVTPTYPQARPPTLDALDENWGLDKYTPSIGTAGYKPGDYVVPDWLAGYYDKAQVPVVRTPAGFTSPASVMAQNPGMSLATAQGIAASSNMASSGVGFPRSGTGVSRGPSTRVSDRAKTYDLASPVHSYSGYEVDKSRVIPDYYKSIGPDRKDTSGYTVHRSQDVAARSPGIIDKSDYWTPSASVGSYREPDTEDYWARGGRTPRKGRAKGLGVVGRLHSGHGGRTDTLPISVPAGAYVIPADIVSALGEGNTEAGMRALETKFGRKRKARGGEVVPIMAAGGEYVVPPDRVRQIGQGSMTMGHAALDKWTRLQRAQHVQTLSRLPGPER